MMKAVVATEYGSADVMQLKTVEKPTAKAGEILIKNHATYVGFGDVMARNFKNVKPHEFNMPAIFYWLSFLEFGFSKPKRQILGGAVSGIVESVGEGVTDYKAGDGVYAYLGSNFGGNAEYVAVAEKSTVAHKPANMTHEESAVIPYGFVMAYNLLKKMNIQAGQKVLINGASGSIGSAALQLAKHYGAEVTGVCGTKRVAMVKALGADHVIDYTKTDFTQTGEKYDIIFDILGKCSFGKAKKALKADGRIYYASFKMKQVWQMLISSRFGRKKAICILAGGAQNDLVVARELTEKGKIKVIIDRCFPLAQAADAHRYFEGGNKTADIVVTVV